VDSDLKSLHGNPEFEALVAETHNANTGQNAADAQNVNQRRLLVPEINLIMQTVRLLGPKGMLVPLAPRFQ
jgi:hypothetical protein